MLIIRPHKINNLQRLFERIGGDQTVKIIEISKLLAYNIITFDKALLDAVNLGLCRSSILGPASDFANIIAFLGSDAFVANAVRWLMSIRIRCKDTEDALHSQKHAFNFIYLRRLIEACKVHRCLL